MSSNANNLSQRYKAYKAGKRNPLAFEEWKRRYGLRAPRGSVQTPDVQDTIRESVPVSTGDVDTDAVIAAVLAALGNRQTVVEPEPVEVAQPDAEAHVKRTRKASKRTNNGNNGFSIQDPDAPATGRQLWALNSRGLLADLIADAEDGIITKGAASDALEMVLA